MKIAFYNLREYDELALCERFSREFGIDFVWTKDAPCESNLSLAKGCIAVSSTPCHMPDEYVDVFHHYGVKSIVCRAIGYDHLPLKHMKELGMRAANSTYPTGCVANYALMLMLMLTRRIPTIMARNVVQDYTLKGKMGRDLSELTVGVAGTGHIGRTLIRNLHSFGCRILAYDLYENEEVRQYARYVDRDTLLSESDVLSLHMLSNEQTYHFINDESIAKMKPGLLLINTARGNLVDSAALIRGLKKGIIGGAGLDVVENEYGLYYLDHSDEVLDNDELAVLRSFPNVIVTPHTAFYTETTIENMIRKNFNAVLCFENGIPCDDEVRFSE